MRTKGNQNVQSQTLTSPFPYDFPEELLANSTALFPMPQCHGVTIEEAKIDTLQQYLTGGNLTSAQLAVCYLQRIWQTQDYIKYVTASHAIARGTDSKALFLRSIQTFWRLPLLSMQSAKQAWSVGHCMVFHSWSRTILPARTGCRRHPVAGLCKAPLYHAIPTWSPS